MIRPLTPLTPPADDALGRRSAPTFPEGEPVVTTPNEPDLIVDPAGNATIRIGGVEIPYPFTVDDLHNAGIVADRPADPARYLDNLFGGKS